MPLETTRFKGCNWVVGGTAAYGRPLTNNGQSANGPLRAIAKRRFLEVKAVIHHDYQSD
ncbi:MAG: hypothetical protein ABJN65_07205 [Parasphingorhabdus sp.]